MLARALGSGRLYAGVRWLLALLFLYAGAAKLADPHAFGRIIADFGLLPEVLVAPAAVILPGMEVAAALGLLLDLRGALGLVVGLLLLFIAVLLYGLRLGLDVDCGCFGPDDPEAHAYGDLGSALARDLCMVLAAAYLYWWRSAQLSRQCRQRLFIRKSL
jgi:hypothetical protein